MSNTVGIVIRVIAAGLLFWALDKHAYAYYILLRWVVCAVCIYIAYMAADLDKKTWIWLIGVIALLFNPILPVHLDKNTWAFIDIFSGIILLVSIFFVRSMNVVKKGSGE